MVAFTHPSPVPVTGIHVFTGSSDAVGGAPGRECCRKSLFKSAHDTNMRPWERHDDLNIDSFIESEMMSIDMPVTAPGTVTVSFTGTFIR